MLTRPIALAILLSACAAPACKKHPDKPDKNDEPAPRATAPTPDAAPRPRITPATEPDLEYEARRDELLRRGDPEMMKPAPVIDPTAVPTAQIQAVSGDVMRVGTIQIDLARGVAEIPAKVVLETGTLEYLAVGPSGKTYESMLSIDVNAVELRLALTLLGHEGTVPDAKGAVAAPTAADTVLVRVRAAGSDQDVPLSSWLLERKTGKHPEDLPWQVIGFDETNRVAALSTPQFLTLVPRDTVAPLRITGDAGNPYAGPDQGLGTDPAAVPPVGTALTLILARRPDSPPLPARSTHTPSRP